MSKKLTNAKSRKLFKKFMSKQNSLNYLMHPQRGGIRL